MFVSVGRFIRNNKNTCDCIHHEYTQQCTLWIIMPRSNDVNSLVKESTKFGVDWSKRF